MVEGLAAGQEMDQELSHALDRRPPRDAATRASATLSTRQKLGLALGVLLLLGFGVVVESRGAFLTRRMTDVNVYFRAAWAVRSGSDIYTVTDDNGWHYNYPPLFAILLVPLADAPAGADRSWMLPYPVSVGLWYVITLAAGFAGVHMLARALEESSPDPAVRHQPRFCRRWWALRILPILIVLPAIGRSQIRGQIGLLLALLLGGMGAAMIRGRRFPAGLWLAASICIKLIPAFLLLLPLWRRDRRMLAGCALGLALGLGVIPVVAIGPRKTADAYREYVSGTLWSGVTGDTANPRGRELTGVTSTDSNSPLVVMHNLRHPDPRARPKEAGPATRALHWAIGGLLTGLTLAAAGWHKLAAGPRDVIFLGALTVVMWIVSPVFHPHYVAMGLPLIVVLVALNWERNGYPRISMGWRVIFGLLVLAHVLTVVPGLEFLRDGGLVLYSTLALWAGSLVALRRA